MRAFTKITAATMLAGGMSVFGAGAAYAAPQEFDAPSMNEKPVSQEAVEQFLGSQEEGSEDPEATEATESAGQDEAPAEEAPAEEAPAEEAPAEEGTEAATRSSSSRSHRKKPPPKRHPPRSRLRLRTRPLPKRHPPRKPRPKRHPRRRRPRRATRSSSSRSHRKKPPPKRHPPRTLTPLRSGSKESSPLGKGRSTREVDRPVSHGPEGPGLFPRHTTPLSQDPAPHRPASCQKPPPTGRHGAGRAGRWVFLAGRDRGPRQGSRTSAERPMANSSSAIASRPTVPRLCGVELSSPKAACTEARRTARGSFGRRRARTPTHCST